jgi:hypothetical protein
MDNVVKFERKQTIIPKTFWDRYKDILRMYYSENDVHLIVAAILDQECYERTNDDIRKVVNIYYQYAPAK